MSKRDIMLALNQTPDGSVPKNGFSLDHYSYMTSKLGQLSVVGCIETVPDADYNVGVDGYTFTMPCNTASLGKMKENFYYLYVPYSQLVNNSYSFFVQRKDNQSALDYSHEQMPFFNLGDVVYRCIEVAVMSDATAKSNGFLDIHGFNIGAGALRLLDLLGYGCYLDLLQAVNDGDLTLANLSTYCTATLNQKKPNALRIAAYQKVWYCYFRNPIYDTTNVTPRSFNFDDVVYHAAGVTPNFNIMAHRDIDNFIKECLQLRYVGYKKDIFTAFMPGTQYGAVSTVGLSVGSSFSITGSGAGTTQNSKGRYINDWSTFSDSGGSDVSSLQPFRISAGDLANDSLNPVTQTKDLIAPSVHRNPNSEDLEYGYTKIYHDHQFSVGVTGTGTLSSGANLFDVLQLVEAQAIQKWKQKSMMAGQRGINQYRAHYGVVPRHMEDHYPDFIGSVDNDIVIDRVISQANTASDVTESTNLGDLGGRGYGASNARTFHCHSTEHGVIMILHAVIPENLYSSYGLDRANQLIYYTDFWQPEYQNIGLEAVPKMVLDVTVKNYGSEADPHSSSSSYPYNNILGFAPRNYQLKQYPSKVHGMFNPTRAVKVAYDADQNLGTLPYGFIDVQSFVLPRRDLNSNLQILEDKSIYASVTLGFNLGKFYVNPHQADTIFVVEAGHGEDSDPFFHKFKINCDSVQPLSVLGLPQF